MEATPRTAATVAMEATGRTAAMDRMRAILHMGAIPRMEATPMPALLGGVIMLEFAIIANPYHLLGKPENS